MTPLRWYRHVAHGDGGIRLAGQDVVEVARPADADVVVLAVCLFQPHRDPAAWARVVADPVLAARPTRVVAYDCADDEIVPPVPGWTYFRCGAPRRLVDAYPTLVPFPWPSPDLGWIRRDAPEGPERRYDVTFQGWVRLPVAERALASVRAAWDGPDAARVHLQGHADFHGYRGHAAGCHRPNDAGSGLSEETLRREAAYREGLRHAWLSLAPESIPSVLRYRTTEALSCGRIPVVIGDGHVFPFADRIAWSRIVVDIAGARAHEVGPILREWLRTVSPEERCAREAEARAAWARWLDKDRHPEIMATIVRERLEAAA